MLWYLKAVQCCFKSKHEEFFSIVYLQKVSGNRESPSSIQLQRKTEKRRLPLHHSLNTTTTGTSHLLLQRDQKVCVCVCACRKQEEMWCLIYTTFQESLLCTLANIFYDCDVLLLYFSHLLIVNIIRISSCKFVYS